MGLKDGTLADLIPRNDETPHFNTAGIVCTHMLRALDFLASKRIIHRDLKPENILYTTVNGEFHLQLGDFGLSNRQEAAATHAGSMLYQAPEFFLGGSQSPKADIWSLFVTIMWTLNTYKLRQIARNRHAFVGIHVLWDKITEAASQPEYAKFQAMARTDPNTRASAAQMLVALFNGKGLTTPRRQIPDIVSLVPAVTPVSPVTAQLPVPGVGNPEPSPAARLRGQAPTRSPALRLNPPAPPVPTIRLPGNGNLKNQPDGPSPLLPAFPAYQRGRRPGLRDLQLQPRGLGQQTPPAARLELCPRHPNEATPPRQPDPPAEAPSEDPTGRRRAQPSPSPTPKPARELTPDLALARGKTALRRRSPGPSASPAPPEQVPTTAPQGTRRTATMTGTRRARSRQRPTAARRTPLDQQHPEKEEGQKNEGESSGARRDRMPGRFPTDSYMGGFI